MMSYGEAYLHIINEEIVTCMEIFFECWFNAIYADSVSIYK